MSYSIRPLRDEDVDTLLPIVETVWGAHAADKFRILHPWFRSRRTAFAHRPTDDLVVTFADRVVGFMRAIPCEYIVDGQRLAAACFADNVTHPEHRGSGLKLARHAMGWPEVLLVGIPVPRAHMLWARMVRPRQPDVTPLERCVVPLRPSVHLARHGVPRFLGAAVDTVWQAWLRTSLRLRTARGSAALAVCDDRKLPAAEEFDAFFQTFAADFYAIAVRDSAFLHWRFLQACMDYRFLWLRDGGRLQGYMVYRQAQLNGRPLLLIVEAMAIGNKRANYLAMLQRVVAHGLACGDVELQTIRSGCKDFYAALKQLGMVSKVETEKLIATVHSDKPYADELTTRTPWYLSLAESDHEFVIYPFTGTARQA